MKTFKYSVLLLVIISSSAYSQESDKYQNFSWESPNGWQGSIFDVPTWFAKDMLYTGREVIRFHDGFYDENSIGFWTYAFVLLVDQTKLPSTDELIEETHRYFLGLVRDLGDNAKPNYPANKVKVTALSKIMTKSNKYQSQYFKLEIFDSFNTGKELSLNLKITTWVCSKDKRAIFYSISPHDFSHEIWNELNQELNAFDCW